MDEIERGSGMGWLPDYPDFRDYDEEHEKIKIHLKKTNAAKPAVKLPAYTDLRAWCSPIKDQGSLGSCTANAGTGIYEYFERKAFGKHIDASRLFLYKTTRNMLHWNGDTGAFLRSTMGALALFGIPPEEYLPYTVSKFDLEPPAFCYAFAQNFQAIQYYRLDPLGTSPAVLLNRVKTNLGSALPSMFGFTVYSSYAQAKITGKIPVPVTGEKIVGGHAVMAVGYDDSMKIKNTNAGAKETTGAVLIRNSWGTGWGSAGYGWLPYDYILRGLAIDWWTMLKGEWLDTGLFK